MWGHRARDLPRERDGTRAFGLDLRIDHDRFESSSDPSIKGH